MKYTLMNVPMTRAIQDDRKTNTRRCIKNTKYADFSSMKIDEKVYPKGRLIDYKYMGKNCSMFSDDFIKEYAKYQIGETIWVREPARVTRCDDIISQIDYKYLADGYNGYQLDIPERFVDDEAYKLFPKWIQNCQGIPNGCIKEMARIFLKITNVRVEKLEDISYEDIVAEGFDVTLHDGTKGQLKKEAFKWWINLWNKTAPKGAKYNDGVYVFVYEFERTENV